MGRGDNRLTRKMRKRKAQKQKKDALRKKINASAEANK